MIDWCRVCVAPSSYIPSPLHSLVAIDKSNSSESGSGGKRGHSNMHYWGTNDEAKDNARKKRRLETKSEIKEQLNDPSEATSVSNSRFDPYAAIQDILNDPEIYNLNTAIRLSTIAKYPAWKQNTYLVLMSQGLVMNGGTPGLFCNDGCMAPAVAKAYEAIGASEHAAWIRKLMALFGAPYPTDFDLINDLLVETPEQPWDTSSHFFFKNENQFEIDRLLENVFHSAQAE